MLLNPNTVVPTERIIDAVWDESPPATARTQVQIQISGLRQLFRRFDGEPVQISTVPGGYITRVDPDDIDCAIFERRVHEAFALISRDRLIEANTELRGALRLWRGRPLGGIDTRFARLEGVRLEELRLSALEQRVALDLRAGKGRGLVSELTALVAEHPLREGLRAHLMLALCQAGRRTDALTAYQVGTRLLRDELGLDPGPTLTELHRAILRADPALTPAWTSTPVPLVPGSTCYLPAPTPDFVGREALLADAIDLLNRPAYHALPLVVTGMAGVGKTAYALALAHKARLRFPEAQLYERLRDGSGRAVDPGEVLRRFLGALGLPAAAVPRLIRDRERVYRGVLAGRRALIVLDDAVDEQQVRPLLPGSGGCAVLITSRARLAGLEGARWLKLDVFTAEEAVELLGRVAGRPRVAADPGAAETIVRLCGHLPLAVRIVGARLAAAPETSLAELAEVLSAAHQRLGRLTAGDLSVRASLASSERGLDEQTRRALQVLALSAPASFAAQNAAALLACQIDWAEHLIAKLIDANLIEVDGIDESGVRRYRIHDLTRLFAREGAPARPSFRGLALRGLVPAAPRPPRRHFQRRSSIAAP